MSASLRARERPGRSTVTTLLIAPLVLLPACSADKPAPYSSPTAAVTTSTSTPVTSGESPTQAAAPVTRVELKSEPVPALCEHKAGRLVNYELPGGTANTGYVEMEGMSAGGYPGPKPVLADLTGDGVVDASVVLGCSAGGVTWPQVVAWYGPGQTLLGWVDLGKVKGVPAREHVDVTRMRPSKGDVQLAFAAYEGAGFDISDWTAKLHYDGKHLVLSGLRRTAPTDGAPLPQVAATDAVAAQVGQYLQHHVTAVQFQAPFTADSGDPCAGIHVQGADLDNGDVDFVVWWTSECGGDGEAAAYRVRDGVVVRSAQVCGECETSQDPTFKPMAAPYDGLRSADFSVVEDGSGWRLQPVQATK